MNDFPFLQRAQVESPDETTQTELDKQNGEEKTRTKGNDAGFGIKTCGVLYLS